MRGSCGNKMQIVWELVRKADGMTELTFCAEKEGAKMLDYCYDVSEMLPPWADHIEEITSVRLDSRIESVGAQSFRNFVNLKEVHFMTDGQGRSALKSIGAQAFRDCRSLESIRIPDSVLKIDDNAFMSAERLRCVEIGSGLNYLGKGVFDYNVSLEELHIASEQLEHVDKSIFMLDHRIRIFHCPDRSIGGAVIRRQIEQIQRTGGEEQTLVADNKGSVTEDGICRKEHGILTDTIRYQLKKMTEEEYCLKIMGTGEMPEWVSRDSQPWRAAANRITEVQVENGISSIGGFAFSGMTGLKLIQLPGTVERVGTAAFGECVSLTEIHFPEGFSILGCRALWGCVSLKSIWLPKTFRIADLMATAYCPEITDVFYAGSEYQWKRNVIIDTMMERNRSMTEAKLHFGEKNEIVFDDRADIDVYEGRYSGKLEEIARLLQTGGDGRLHVVAINLGNSFLSSKIGDSTLILFPQGSTMLIDTGACGARKHLIDFMRRIGLSKLNYLVFTHPHGDHFGGALELLRYLYEEKGGTIGEAWYSLASENRIVVRPVMQALEYYGVPLKRIKVREDGTGEYPEKMEIQGVELLAYGPNENDIRLENEMAAIETANNVSLVLRFNYGKTVFLTAGDIYRTKERYLLDTYGSECFRADVLKMNHHGNFQSSITEWIEATRPQIAYAEADGNGNSDVMRRFMKTGAACYTTGLDGMLHISMGKENDCTVWSQFDSSLKNSR